MEGEGRSKEVSWKMGWGKGRRRGWEEGRSKEVRWGDGEEEAERRR
jgi:hypothetical protein